MPQQQNKPFRFMSFCEWVPDSLRFWIYILFLISFQFSNGIYFTAMTQMQGGLAVTMNDVKMFGHAILIGLTMYFPLAFRLKFRFANRTCLLMASAGLMLCNIIVPYIHSVPLLVIICFVAGFIRLFGTFECFSSILPKITPTYNYAIFLSFVFFVVLGVIHLFDIASTYIIYYYNWHYVHYAAIGLLLLTFLGTFILMRPFRAMPKMPLYSIDWLGMILWSIFILSLIFVAQYGEQLNWLHSTHIRVALGASCLALAANVWRMTNVRHPFLELRAFKVKNLINLLVLFFLMDILLSTQTVLQNTYTAAILNYDQLTNASLKWFEFLGMCLGAVFCLITLTRLKWPHKNVTFIGMAAIVMYVAAMYFIVSAQANIEKLYIPQMLCGFGHVVIFIALTVYAQATAPFKNYFQVLCILGLIRTGIASPVGDAIYTRALTGLVPQHIAAIGSDLNAAVQLPFSEIAAAVGNEALLATIKELFGWSVIFGIIVLIVILASHFKRNIGNVIPLVPQVYKIALRAISFKGKNKKLNRV